MKSKYANKGKAFEKQLINGFEQLHNLGIIRFCKLNVETKYKNGAVHYCKKQLCDYIIFTKTQSWAVDAKECAKSKWYPKTAPLHQRDNLLWMQQNNKKGAFLVLFKTHSMIRVITDFTIPATPESGILFDWKMFLI